MDIQILKKFLAVARAENISKAADALHISQPPLSKQLHDLEAELGHALLVRGSKKTTLTAEGLLLQKRAEEILQLVEKTQSEVQNASQNIKGDVYIGAGETVAMSILADAIKDLKKECPAICYHVTSGDGKDLREQLERGLIDFALFIGEWDIERYNFIKLPFSDRWGAVMPKTHPLAKKSAIEVSDLKDEPLLLSRQAMLMGTLNEWLGRSVKEFTVAGTFNLAYNAGCFSRAGLGVAITLDKLLDTSEESELCFRPLSPALYAPLRFAWKKGQVFSPCAKRFLEFLQGRL